jgi:hypothetical protein
MIHISQFDLFNIGKSVVVMDAFYGKQFGRRRKKQQVSVNQEGPAGED